MSEERNKWIDAVAKMIKLTQDGKIEWRQYSSTADLKEDASDVIEAAFISDYGGKKLRIHRRVFRDSRPTPKIIGRGSPTSIFFSESVPEMESYRASEVRLEFISPNGNALWTYPNVNGLSDLLSAVQYQVAGVKDFLDEILKDES
jgi:hypothetical protein